MRISFISKIQVYVPPFWLGRSGWNFPYAQTKKFVQVTRLAQLPGSCEETLRSNHVYKKCLEFLPDIPLWVKFQATPKTRTWYLLRAGGSFFKRFDEKPHPLLYGSPFLGMSCYFLPAYPHPTRIKLSSGVLLCRAEHCGRRLCGPFSSSTKILSLTSLTTFFRTKKNLEIIHGLGVAGVAYQPRSQGFSLWKGKPRERGWWLNHPPAPPGSTY